MDSYVKISVGIPFFNAEKFLFSSIQSVLNQTFKDYELILLDDGSLDNSLSIARSFKDPRIHIYTDGKNQGIGSRLNELISLAKGKYFVRMDADDMMFPDRLDIQFAFMEKNPSMDVAGGHAVIIDDFNNLIGKRIPILNSSPHSVIKHAVFIHPTVIGKTEWFVKNRYDPSLSGPEDYDLWIRTFSFSNFSIIPCPLIFYRDPKRLRLSTYINRQKQILLILGRIKNPTISKFFIFRFRLYIILKSRIFSLFYILGLDGLIIKSRNLSLNPFEKNKFAKILFEGLKIST
jgi:glycosyltransferase involved in cell wall biosynthesis